MRQSIWNKRFPTLIGLLVIGISTFVLSYIVKSPQTLLTGASESIDPQDLHIRVSNQTATSLSISFQTKDPITAQLNFGETIQATRQIFDERDGLGEIRGQYKTHYFTVTGLSAGAQYVYTIRLSQSKDIDNNGSPFLVKTATVIPNRQRDIPSGALVRGTALDSLGAGVEGGLVFVTLDGVAPISMLLRSEGKFELPLTNLYTADLTSVYSLQGNEILSVEIIGDDGTGSIITVPFGQQDTLGTITLGKNMDVTKDERPLTSAFSANALPTPQLSATEPDIITPHDGEFLIDAKPLIRGKGKPSQKIEITVESDPQVANLTVGENGEWVYQPDTPLPPGKHTISVRFFEGDEVTHILQNTFEVLASGSQVVEAATLSPTIVIETPTHIPSISAVPTTPPVPTTGSVMPGIFIGIAGVILTCVGFFARRVYSSGLTN